MYAIGAASRAKTESVGKLAIGIKDSGLDSILISDISYIMFHYWNNEKAIPYKILNIPLAITNSLRSQIATAKNYRKLGHSHTHSILT